MKTTILLLAYTCDIVPKVPNWQECVGKMDGTATIQLNYSTTQEYADAYTNEIKRLRTDIATSIETETGNTISGFSINCIGSWTVGI